MFSVTHRAFHDEVEAHLYVERVLWPDGPTCPRCAGRERVGRLGGQSTRIGVLKCYACCKPFTVKIGTLFESSHVPMRLWLQAIHLLGTARRPVAVRSIAEVLGITYKSAWCLRARIGAGRGGSPPAHGRDGVAASDEPRDEARLAPEVLQGLSRQSQRFVQASLELRCDPGGEAFHALFRQVALGSGEACWGLPAAALAPVAAPSAAQPLPGPRAARL